MNITIHADALFVDLSVPAWQFTDFLTATAEHDLTALTANCYRPVFLLFVVNAVRRVGIIQIAGVGMSFVDYSPPVGR